MRRDDVERALDALASDVPAPSGDASTVVRRGRRRTRQRRITIVGVVATLVVVAAAVGAVTHDDRSKPPALHTVEHQPHTVAGAGTYEIAAPSALEAWKCRNPIEYTNNGGRMWRTTELAGAPKGQLPCTAVAGGAAWAFAGGHVFRVRDGGAHVDEFTSPVASSAGVSVPTFVDSEHGWFRKEDHGPSHMSLYRTNDGGASWTRVTERRLQALSFASPELGWSGNGSNILRTTDGGETWRSVHRASEHLFQTVAIPDGAVAWEGIRIKGTQYRDVFEITGDGGTTWTRRETADFERLNERNYFFASDATHWQQTSGNALRVTSDAGRTWTARPDLPAGTNGPIMVTFPTADVGWFTTDRGALFRTADGGRTWANVTVGGAPAVVTPPQPVPIPLAFVSPTEGWLCSGGTMLYTTDAGKSWKNVAVPSHPPVPPRSQLPVCTAVPGGDAWMLTTSADGDGLQVIHVSESGRLVETSAFPPLRSDWTVRDLAFADRQRGWAFATDAAGGASTMLSTNDGGRTWNDDAPVRGVTLFGSPDDGWAALELLPSELAHTTDGGRTWERVDVDYGSAGTLRPIAVSGQTVVALAWSATNADVPPSFAVTHDGGSYWARVRAPRELATTPGAQIAANATDGEHWQVAAGNKLWTTETGGRSWHEVAEFAGFSAITDVQFLTPDVGFVAATGLGTAANGTVVEETTDGGDTWSTVASHAPPFNSRTAQGVNFPGGIIGCPTKPLARVPAGNPPAGLVRAATQYAGHGANAWTPTDIQAYHLGDNPAGSFGYLFRYQVGSCGPATLANGWVVEMHGPAIKGRAYIPRAYLAFAHYANGWHVFGRYP